MRLKRVRSSPKQFFRRSPHQHSEKLKNLETRVKGTQVRLVRLVLTLNMCDKILCNKYIPKYVLEDLPWYEWDGHLTYIDQLKYKEFISNPDRHMKKAEVINFDIIYARCGCAPQQYSDRYYQTVHTSDVKKIPQKDRKKAIGACLRSTRKDVHIEKKLTLSHFLEK